MRGFYIVFLGLMMGAGFSLSAQAQVQMPEFSISNIPTMEMESTGEFDYDTAFGQIRNPVMADILRLQYQINLLDRLIRRQTEIESIAKAYKTIGIPFIQPPLPESSCEQLPINVLCMAFYPESAKYEALIAERQTQFQADRQREMQSIMLDYDLSYDDAAIEMESQQQSGSDGSTPTRVTRSTAEAPRRKTAVGNFAWSDIRCLSGQCSALLEDVTDSTVRFRIREGEDLPNDNGSVASITSAGVSITHEGKNIVVRPVNVAARPEGEARDTSRIADIISDNLGEEALPSTDGVSAQSVDDNAIAPQPVASDVIMSSPAAPLLGVTGLF